MKVRLLIDTLKVIAEQNPQAEIFAASDEELNFIAAKCEVGQVAEGQYAIYPLTGEEARIKQTK